MLLPHHNWGFGLSLVCQEVACGFSRGFCTGSDCTIVSASTSRIHKVNSVLIPRIRKTISKASSPVTETGLKPLNLSFIMTNEDSSPDEDQPLSQSKVDILNPHLQEPTIAEIQAAAKQTLNLDHEAQCHRFSEGTDHAVYAIGDQYVARCLPSSDRAIKNLRRDAAVQRLAKNYISNPEIIAEVLDSPLKVGEWQGNIERRIQGISLHQSSPTPKTEEDLAKFLLDMRSVPIEEALAAPGYQREKVNIKLRITKAIRAWEEVVSAGHAEDPANKIREAMDGKLRLLKSLPEDPYTPTFVHGDLNTENILLSPNTGSIAGIIDWSDAIVGDPCIDISGVMFAIGASGARRVANLAGQSEYAIERALLYAMTVVVRDLKDVLCGDGDEWGRDESHLLGLLEMEFGKVFEGSGCDGLLVKEREQSAGGLVEGAFQTQFSDL